MKILYTIGRYWPAIGGAELQTRELVRHITKRHEAMVACLRNDFYRDEWLYGWTIEPQEKQRPYFDGKTEVRVLRLGFFKRMSLRKKLVNYYSDEAHRTSCKQVLADLFMRELVKINRSFDIVHNIMIGEEFFSLASLYYARKNRIPFVFTTVSHPDGWRSELFSYLYKNADALIAMTEAEKAFLVSQGAHADRISVTGVGPIINNFTPGENIRRKLSIDGPIVLFLGQKIHYKGIEQMLEAAEIVWARHPKTNFIFAGPPTDYSRKLFADQHDPRIIEPGIISDEEKTSFLSGCDIFCMPSVCESFGGVYLEAWSFRKPVIAADTEVSRCFIEDGRDGLLVKQEATSIAAAICSLLGDAALRKRLGEKGFDEVTSRHSWTAIVSKVASAYQRAIAARPGSDPARPSA